MADIARWTSTLERNRQVLGRQIDGVTQERSLRPLYPGGSTLNWMIGHLASGRNSMLTACHAETIDGDALAAAYGYGTRPPEAASAHDVADLLAVMERQEARLADAFAHLDDDAFAAPSGMGDATVERFVSFMIWHETYHLGQAALYRGAAGLESAIR